MPSVHILSADEALLRRSLAFNLEQAGYRVSTAPSAEDALVLAALLLVTSVVLAANGYEISRYVIGGGGRHSEADPYTLDATVGQAVVGVTSSDSYELCAGFWCGMGEYKVYLPIILRNFTP